MRSINLLFEGWVAAAKENSRRYYRAEALKAIAEDMRITLITEAEAESRVRQWLFDEREQR